MTEHCNARDNIVKALVKDKPLFRVAVGSLIVLVVGSAVIALAALNEAAPRIIDSYIQKNLK